MTRQMLDLARIQPGQRILSAPERESVWNEVEDALRSFESAGGFAVPGECLVGSATR